MIKVLGESRQDSILYVCAAGENLDSIARDFGISPAAIKRSNPLFSSVYPGCMLLLENTNKRQIVVGPLETLESIAVENNTTVEKIMKINNLKSSKIFVGMHLFLDI